MSGPRQIVAASLALAVCAAACWGDRPLRRPRTKDAGTTIDARDAVAPTDLTPQPDVIFIPSPDAIVSASCPA